MSIPGLVEEEDEMSVNEGDTNADISKSFLDIESSMYRCLDRLKSKEKQKAGYYTFIPELDFGLTNPMAFASKHDNESYTFREMMKQPDASDFVSAMEKEIGNHEMNECWDVVPRASTGGKKVLKSIWAFKRKRDPDGSLDKHKARICPHGGMQQCGVDFWETYSLVVSWLTIRLIFAFCVVRKMVSILLDFD